MVILLRNEYFGEYMPQKMKVSNHKEYNQFLEKRGNVFHFIDEAIENWYESSGKISGGNNIYSDKVVIAVHIIVNLFRIGLRQAVERIFRRYREESPSIHKLVVD